MTHFSVTHGYGVAHGGFHRGDVYDPECSARDVLELIGSKWVLLILPLLAAGPLRNAALQRRVGGISQKMLAQTLRALERNGLVARTRGEDGRRIAVSYALTPLGASLWQALAALDRWAERHFVELDRAREAYDLSRADGDGGKAGGAA